MKCETHFRFKRRKKRNTKRNDSKCRIYRSIWLMFSSLVIGFSYFIIFFYIEQIGKPLDGFSSGNCYYSQSYLLGSIQFIH